MTFVLILKATLEVTLVVMLKCHLKGRQNDIIIETGSDVRSDIRIDVRIDVSNDDIRSNFSNNDRTNVISDVRSDARSDVRCVVSWDVINDVRIDVRYPTGIFRITFDHARMNSIRVKMDISGTVKCLKLTLK